MIRSGHGDPECSWIRIGDDAWFTMGEPSVAAAFVPVLFVAPVRLAAEDSLPFPAVADPAVVAGPAPFTVARPCPVVDAVAAPPRLAGDEFLAAGPDCDGDPLSATGAPPAADVPGAPIAVTGAGALVFGGGGGGGGGGAGRGLRR